MHLLRFVDRDDQHGGIHIGERQSCVEAFLLSSWSPRQSEACQSHVGMVSQQISHDRNRIEESEGTDIAVSLTSQKPVCRLQVASGALQVPVSGGLPMAAPIERKHGVPGLSQDPTQREQLIGAVRNQLAVRTLGAVKAMQDHSRDIVSGPVLSMQVDSVLGRDRDDLPRRGLVWESDPPRGRLPSSIIDPVSRKEVHVEASGREIRISSPDKVVFPDQGWSKLDVVDHFLMCGDGGLRGVYNRPVSLKRWTKGVKHEPFFVKRVPESARSIVDVRFPSARPGRMFLPLDIGDVIWMAQMNCLDLNPWNARGDDIDHPDELRIDLDPADGYDFSHAREVAAAARELLDELGYTGYPKTSGNRGIHIYVRIRPEWDYFQMRRGVLAFARELERRHELATTAWWKEEREGVFVDYNQVARDRTIASAYSVRHTGFISTPFAWSELTEMDPADFDLMTFKDRWLDVGDLTVGIDDEAFSLRPLLEMVAADEEQGIGDAPWPPHYPKMPGEPPRVQPSKMRKENWE